MLIVVYLDILIALNFMFNFMLLYLTRWLVKQAVSRWRILIGTMIATIFIPIQLFVPIAFLDSAIINILLSFAIIWSTFRSKNLLRNVLYFYFVSFIIGGGTMALHSIFENVLLSNSYMFVVDNVEGSKTSIVLLLISSFVLFHFTKKQLNEHTRDQYMYKQQYDIALKINGIEKETIGYVDSGNHLTETLSRRPVIICDEAYLHQFFTEKEWEAIRYMIEHDEYVALPTHLQNKLTIVPYQGVGGETKHLYTIKVDNLMVIKEDERLETNHVLVGIQLKDLRSDQAYHCLLHPDVIHIHALQVA